MKTAFLLLFISLSAFAQKPPPVAEENRWLYELLFTEADRTAQPAESFKSFWPHLLDSFQVFPHPDKLKAEFRSQGWGDVLVDTILRRE